MTVPLRYSWIFARHAQNMCFWVNTFRLSIYQKQVFRSFTCPANQSLSHTRQPRSSRFCLYLIINGLFVCSLVFVILSNCFDRACAWFPYTSDLFQILFARARVCVLLDFPPLAHPHPTFPPSHTLPPYSLPHPLPLTPTTVPHTLKFIHHTSFASRFFSHRRLLGFLNFFPTVDLLPPGIFFPPSPPFVFTTPHTF